MVALPLCKDCKHSFSITKQGIDAPREELYCKHPIIGTHINPVTGQGRAAIGRNDKTLCGKEGAYFELSETVHLPNLPE